MSESGYSQQRQHDECDPHHIFVTSTKHAHVQIDKSQEDELGAVLKSADEVRQTTRSTLESADEHINAESDESLLQTLADAKTTEARETIVLGNLFFLLGSASSNTFQPCDQEDLFQNMALQLLKPSEDFDPTKGNANSYVRSQTQFAPLSFGHNMKKLQKREHLMPTINDSGKYTMDSFPSPGLEEPLVTLELNELKAKMRSAMQQMKSRHNLWWKTIVEYFGLSDDTPKSTQKIADARGCTKSAVSRQLRDGIRELQFLMGETDSEERESRKPRKYIPVNERGGNATAPVAVCHSNQTETTRFH